MNLDREKLISELGTLGLPGRATDVNKNGTVLHGIVMQLPGEESTNACSPILYLEDMAKYDSEQEAAEAIAGYIELNLSTIKQGSDQIKELLRNKDAALGHIYIGLQKAGIPGVPGGIVCRSKFDGIDEYLYVRVNSGRIRNAKNFLEAAGITEEEAWEKAKGNTFAEISIQSMADTLSELTGGEEATEVPNMYVVSNKLRMFGAACVLCEEEIARLAHKCGTKKFVLIPSSVHEMLLLPDAEDVVSIDDINDMVRDINNSMLEPKDVLSDHAYELYVDNPDFTF